MRPCKVFGLNRTKVFHVKHFCPIGGDFLTYRMRMPRSGFRPGSAVLVWAPFGGITGGLAGDSWPFNQADGHAAQTAHILLGELHAMEYVAQIAPHHRLLGLWTEEARAVQLGFEIIEK